MGLTYFLFFSFPFLASFLSFPVFIGDRFISCGLRVISCGASFHVGLKSDGIILCDLVCQNEAISDTRMAVGMASIATEADFRFDQRKVLFPFSECRNRVFL
jgi:hypothetical protein